MSIYTVSATRNIQNFSSTQSGDISTNNDFLSTYLGHLAGFKNLGKYNTFVGYEAGLENYSGSCNTFLGHDAGASNSLGNANLFLGVAAGLGNVSGDDNNFLGFRAGLKNTTGKQNVFLGNQAGQYLNGNGNVLIGYNNTNTATQPNSCNNVSIGTGAIAIGAGNTVLGTGSLATGRLSTVLGYCNSDAAGRNSALLGNNIRNTGANTFIVMTGCNATAEAGFSNAACNYMNINHALVASGADSNGRYTDVTLGNYGSSRDGGSNQLQLSPDGADLSGQAVTVDSRSDLLLRATHNITLSNSTTGLTLNPDLFTLDRKGQNVTLADEALYVTSCNQLLMRSASNASLAASNQVLLSTPSNYVQLGLGGLQVASAPSLTIASSNSATLDAAGGDLLLHASCNLVLSNSSTSMTLNPDFFKLQRNGQYVNLAQDALTINSTNLLNLQSASNASVTACNSLLLQTPYNGLSMGSQGVSLASGSNLSLSNQTAYVVMSNGSLYLSAACNVATAAGSAWSVAAGATASVASSNVQLAASSNATVASGHALSLASSNTASLAATSNLTLCNAVAAAQFTSAGFAVASACNVTHTASNNITESACNAWTVKAGVSASVASSNVQLAASASGSVVSSGTLTFSNQTTYAAMCNSSLYLSAVSNIASTACNITDTASSAWTVKAGQTATIAASNTLALASSDAASLAASNSLTLCNAVATAQFTSAGFAVASACNVSVAAAASIVQAASNNITESACNAWTATAGQTATIAASNTLALASSNAASLTAGRALTLCNAVAAAQFTSSGLVLSSSSNLIQSASNAWTAAAGNTWAATAGVQATIASSNVSVAASSSASVTSAATLTLSNPIASAQFTSDGLYLASTSNLIQSASGVLALASSNAATLAATSNLGLCNAVAGAQFSSTGLALSSGSNISIAAASNILQAASNAWAASAGNTATISSSNVSLGAACNLALSSSNTATISSSNVSLGAACNLALSSSNTAALSATSLLSISSSNMIQTAGGSWSASAGNAATLASSNVSLGASCNLVASNAVASARFTSDGLALSSLSNLSMSNGAAGLTLDSNGLRATAASNLSLVGAYTSVAGSSNLELTSSNTLRASAANMAVAASSNVTISNPYATVSLGRDALALQASNNVTIGASNATAVTAGTDMALAAGSTASVAAGSNMSLTASNAVQVASGGEVTLSNPGASIALQDDGLMSLTASNQLRLVGSREVSIAASNTVSLAASNSVDIAAQELHVHSTTYFDGDCYFRGRLLGLGDQLEIAASNLLLSALSNIDLQSRCNVTVYSSNIDLVGCNASMSNVQSVVALTEDGIRQFTLCNWGAQAANDAWLASASNLTMSNPLSYVQFLETGLFASSLCNASLAAAGQLTLSNAQSTTLYREDGVHTASVCNATLAAARDLSLSNAQSYALFQEDGLTLASLCNLTASNAQNYVGLLEDGLRLASRCNASLSNQQSYVDMLEQGLFIGTRCNLEVAAARELALTNPQSLLALSDVGLTGLSLCNIVWAASNDAALVAGCNITLSNPQSYANFLETGLFMSSLCNAGLTAAGTVTMSNPQGYALLKEDALCLSTACNLVLAASNDVRVSGCNLQVNAVTTFLQDVFLGSNARFYGLGGGGATFGSNASISGDTISLSNAVARVLLDELGLSLNSLSNLLMAGSNDVDVQAGSNLNISASNNVTIGGSSLVVNAVATFSNDIYFSSNVKIFGHASTFLTSCGGGADCECGCLTLEELKHGPIVHEMEGSVIIDKNLWVHGTIHCTNLDIGAYSTECATSIVSRTQVTLSNDQSVQVLAEDGWFAHTDCNMGLSAAGFISISNADAALRLDGAGLTLGSKSDVTVAASNLVINALTTFSNDVYFGSNVRIFGHASTFLTSCDAGDSNCDCCAGDITLEEVRRDHVVHEMEGSVVIDHDLWVHGTMHCTNLSIGRYATECATSIVSRTQVTLSNDQSVQVLAEDGWHAFSGCNMSMSNHGAALVMDGATGLGLTSVTDVRVAASADIDLSASNLNINARAVFNGDIVLGSNINVYGAAKLFSGFCGGDDCGDCCITLEDVRRGPAVNEIEGSMIIDRHLYVEGTLIANAFQLGSVNTACGASIVSKNQITLSNNQSYLIMSERDGIEGYSDCNVRLATAGTMALSSACNLALGSSNDVVVSSCNLLINATTVFKGDVEFSNVRIKGGLFGGDGSNCTCKTLEEIRGDYIVNDVLGSTVVEHDLYVGGVVVCRSFQVGQLSTECATTITSSTTVSMSNGWGFVELAQDGVHIVSESNLTVAAPSLDVSSNVAVGGVLQPSVARFASSSNKCYWDQFVAGSNDLVFKSCGGAQVTFDDDMCPGPLNFTATHRCGPVRGGKLDRARRQRQRTHGGDGVQDLVGKIVIASGDYLDLNNKRQMHIDEAVPTVELCTRPYDKRAFGVVGAYDREGKFKIGNMGFKNKQPIERFVVQSAGEGLIWVCDLGGPLRNGDYVVTSRLPGYGMRQKDDVRRACTVAKVTCDCTFGRADRNKYRTRALRLPGGAAVTCALVGCVYAF